MNIQDINFAEETGITIIELVESLYNFWKNGGTQEQLEQIWSQIANKTRILVNNYNQVVSEASK
ncbi:MAG: hypothetical protein QXV17_07540 [Candidatus Micrarchaeaceae archaeon]